MNRYIHQSAPHSREILDLGAGDVVRLTDAQGVSIFVRAGTAWITEHGHPDDIVVSEGECFSVDRPGLVLVTPIHGATVVISAPPERARTCRIERIHRDGQHYPVLCRRPQPVPTAESRLAPAFRAALARGGPAVRSRRQVAGATPVARLNARLNAASDS